MQKIKDIGIIIWGIILLFLLLLYAAIKAVWLVPAFLLEYWIKKASANRQNKAEHK